MPPYVMRVPSFQPGFTGISSTSCARALLLSASAGHGVPHDGVADDGALTSKASVTPHARLLVRRALTLGAGGVHSALCRTVATTSSITGVYKCTLQARLLQAAHWPSMHAIKGPAEAAPPWAAACRRAARGA